MSDLSARPVRDDESSATSEEARGARRFGSHALIYLVSSLLVRGLAIFLTPLYTRVMSPADFAIVAVANALMTALSIVVSLAIHGSIPRLLHDHAPGPPRRRFLGAITAFAILAPLGAGALLEAAGWCGLLDVFETVHFHPHLELVIWSAVFTSMFNLPTSIYMALEEPRKVSALNVASGLAQLGVTILLVAVLRQGALGVLRASCLSAGLLAFVSCVLLFRMSDLTISWPLLRPALAYSIPLVPHLLANWALAVSDRLVLERFVSAADLGRYSLGYMLSIAVSVVAAAVTTPLTAAANRQLGDPASAKNIPPLGTYALLMTTTCALLAAVCSRELIALLAPRAYADAARVVPWVVAGAALQGVYLVWSTGTWYSKKTGAIPLVTLMSVLVNVGVNILFVPRYGMIVAAIATTIGYAAAAAGHGVLSQRNHPIPWEYRRWIAMAVSALVSYFVVQWITFDNRFVGVVVKSLACLIVFAAGLVALGFARADELSRVAARFRSRR